MTSLGLGLIGVGMWGRKMGAAAQRADGVHLAACFARDEAARTDAAEAFGCRAPNSLRHLLDDPEVEAVLVVTPNHTHAAVAERAAASGRHVFVEKPIADTLANGSRLAEACGRAGLVLFVGHSFRRLGAARAAAAAIADGSLGEVVLAEANFSLPGAFAPGSWRSSRVTLPGGPMTQLGVHHADTLQAWIGPAVSVRGSMTHLTVAADIDDVAVAVVEHASGARSVIACSYVSPKTYRIRVYGTRANLEYRTDMSIWPQAERMDEATTLTVEDATGAADLPFEPRDMLVDELEAFARCIRSGELPETGAAEGLAALRVIEAVVEASQSGGIQRLEEEEGSDAEDRRGLRRAERR